MEKIVVPTDFSDNSKAGLRFAIRLAARNKAKLIFTNVLQVKRPLTKENIDFETVRAEQIAKTQAKLEAFVKKLYQSLSVEVGEYECEVIEGIKVDICLLDYCGKHPDVNLIVISTRGASFLNKVLGTNTGNLVTKSTIPVIAVPKDYRYKPLRNVLYASDLKSLDNEFDRVLDFAKPRGLSVEILHFLSPSTRELAANLPVEKLEEKAGYPLNIRLLEFDPHQPMVENLRNQISKIKPSLVILFTNQHRKFYEKLFLSSMSESLSFKSQTPLLVLGKA